MKRFKVRQRINKEMQRFVYWWTIRIIIRIAIWWRCFLGNWHWKCILQNCCPSCIISCLHVYLIQQLWNWKLPCFSLIKTFIIYFLRCPPSKMNWSLTWTWTSTWTWNSSCHCINAKQFVWIHSTWCHFNDFPLNGESSTIDFNDKPDDLLQCFNNSIQTSNNDTNTNPSNQYEMRRDNLKKFATLSRANAEYNYLRQLTLTRKLQNRNVMTKFGWLEEKSCTR